MITEEEMTYEDMVTSVKGRKLCAECQQPVNIAWGGTFGVESYILRCGSDVNHKGITGHDRKYEKQREEYFMDSTALEKMTEEKMLARVNMAKFPQDLTAPEKKLLAQVAITYGFDPLMGEVTIYQGRPYVSIDGRYRKAQETNNLAGVESRPATKQEREDWEIPNGDYFFRADIHVKGDAYPFVGWGRVRKAETTGGKGFKPIETNPQRMAEKRAEAMALRKAFHIPLPSFEDIGAPDYDVESTARVVDQDTGEITETTQTTITQEEQEPTPEATSDTTRASKAIDGGNGIDMDTMRLKVADLMKRGWTTIAKDLRERYKVDGKAIMEMVGKLTPEQAEWFEKEVHERLEMR